MAQKDLSKKEEYQVYTEILRHVQDMGFINPDDHSGHLYFIPRGEEKPKVIPRSSSRRYIARLMSHDLLRFVADDRLSLTEKGSKAAEKGFAAFMRRKSAGDYLRRASNVVTLICSVIAAVTGLLHLFL